MSRTKRVYNHPNLIFYEYLEIVGWKPLWHPWKVMWASSPPGGKKYKRYLHKQHRARNKSELEIELTNI